MNRTKLSEANPESDLFTVTRNEDPKTFSEFVDQVITNAPVNLPKKSISTLYKRDSDPISVLHNHGLLNIDKAAKVNNCPGSEIDVTFYTEETHLGELVKLFSSTHTFRNGKLVYATTQEVAPQVAEEVDKFNKRWQLECSPEMIREKEEKTCQSFTSHIPKKKSLMNMLSDLDREQILKRYGKTSRRDYILHKEPSSKPGCYCEKKETTYNNDFKNERIEKCFEESHEIKSDCCLKEDFSNNYQQNKDCNVPDQKPVGKKIYHAAWRQISPQKSPSKTVRFTMEQSVKDKSPKIPKTSKIQKAKSIRTDKAQVSKKYSRSTIKGLCLQSESSESSDYPLIFHRHAEGCENELDERLKGQKCRYPFNVRDKNRNQPSVFYHTRLESNEAGDRYIESNETRNETYSQSIDSHKSNRGRSKSQAQRNYSHCCAEGDIFIGDNEESSSGSNTSICTIYYDCDNEYANKRTSPLAGNKKDDCRTNKHYYNEKLKSGGNKKITGHEKGSENVGLFHNWNKSHSKKSSRRNLDCEEIDEVLRHCCHEKRDEKTRFQKSSPPRHQKCSSNIDIECFAECRQRNNGKQQVNITRGSMKNVKSLMSLDDDSIMKNMVNAEALREFNRRYGKCLCFMDDLSPSPSDPRKHFIKQIKKTHRHKHL